MVVCLWVSLFKTKYLVIITLDEVYVHEWGQNSFLLAGLVFSQFMFFLSWFDQLSMAGWKRQF